MPVIQDDRPDAENDQTRYDAAGATDPDVIIYRISGAFFFGAAAGVAAALDSIGEHPKAYIVDFSDVSIIDSTAASTIAGFARKVVRQNAALYITGAELAIRRELLLHGAGPPSVSFADSVAQARELARSQLEDLANGVELTAVPPNCESAASPETDNDIEKIEIHLEKSS
jgi:SulP family sulfate permease